MRPRGRACRLTEYKWAQVLALVIQEDGRNFNEIARRVSLNNRTVRRLFHEGYPGEPWGRTPMRALLDQERVRTRALRQKLGEPQGGPPIPPAVANQLEMSLGAATGGDHRGAAKDALEARTAEARLVMLSRGNVVALAGAAVMLLKPAQNVAKHLGVYIESQILENKLEPLQGMRVLRHMSAFVKDLVETGERVMDMERLLLGDPTGGGKIVSLASTMTEEDARIELTNASKILSALEARGLRVINGGRGAPEESAAAPAAAPKIDGGGVAFDSSSSRTTVAAAAPATADVVEKQETAPADPLSPPTTEDEEGEPTEENLDE